MNRILCLLNDRKSGLSQIINSAVWAVMMIVISHVVDDLSTKEFLITMHIAGWFASTFTVKGNLHKK